MEQLCLDAAEVQSTRERPRKTGRGIQVEANVVVQGLSSDLEPLFGCRIPRVCEGEMVRETVADES